MKGLDLIYLRGIYFCD